jgi:hypothetical protein
LTPPEHRSVERRAHARRLEELSEIRGFVRVRNDPRVLVLHTHPGATSPTWMLYTHVLNRPWLAVGNPVDA